MTLVQRAYSKQLETMECERRSVLLKGLFLAYGPAFLQRQSVEEFEVIELYNLMAREYYKLRLRSNALLFTRNSSSR